MALKPPKRYAKTQEQLEQEFANDEYFQSYIKQHEKDLEAIKLKEDELARLKKGEKPIDEEISDSAKDKVTTINIDKLFASPKNVFEAIEGDKWVEFVENIRDQGLIYNVIVRPKSCIETYSFEEKQKCTGEFEILAGHNRVRALSELGVTEIPCNIVEVDDERAIDIINGSNLQREKVSEYTMCLAYKNKYDISKIKGHNRYTEKDKILEVDKLSTSKNDKTRDKLGAEYGISGRTFERRAKMGRLIPKLFKLYERRSISQNQALNLSYLDTHTQEVLLLKYKDGRISLTENNCKALKEEYQKYKKEGEFKSHFPERLMEDVMRENGIDIKPIVPVRPKKFLVADKYFPEKLKKGDRQDYINFALEYMSLNADNIFEEIFEAWNEEKRDINRD